MKRVSLNLCLFGEESSNGAGSTESFAGSADMQNSDPSAAPVGGRENEKNLQSEVSSKSADTNSSTEDITANISAPQEHILPPDVMHVIQSLAAVYQLQETDVDGIASAFNRTQARNALEERLHRRSAARQYQAFLDEAEVLSKKVRGFDLKTELNDSRFCRLLQCGFSMEEAWQTVHMQQLLCAVVRQASENAAKKAVDQYRRWAARPEENGVKGQSGIARKTSVEHLTGRGIRDILRRVEKGAKVKF